MSKDLDESKSEHPRPTWGLVGAIFVFTLFAQFVSLGFGRARDDLPFSSLFFPSLVFLTAFTLPATWFGIFFGPKFGLGVKSFLSSRKGDFIRHFGPNSLLAIISGSVFGGFLLLLRVWLAPYLPSELPEYGHRGVVGGLAVSFGAAVAEEVWFRLGLMTFLVWLISKFRSATRVSNGMVRLVILVTAFGFGAAHLPQLLSYGAGSSFAIWATVLGNVTVGVLYGWCYWRKGLFIAMIAHFSLDLVLHVLPAMF